MIKLPISLLAVLLFTPALACDNHHHHDHAEHRILQEGRSFCGTPELTPKKKSQARVAISDHRARKSKAAARMEPVNIDIVFNVIHDGDATGLLSSSEITTQVDVLNNAYGPSEFAFNLRETNYYDNAEWFYNCGPDTETFKAEIRLELDPNDTGINMDVLYIYTCQPVTIDHGEVFGLGGYATFPFDNEGLPDGVVLLHSAFPGGPIPGYDEGAVATHEVSFVARIYNCCH